MYSFFYTDEILINVFYFVSSFLHPDAGGSLKIQDSPNSYSALLELKKIHELFRKKNQNLENEIIALQKKLIETREEKSKLENEIVEQDEEFWTLRYDTLL